MTILSQMTTDQRAELLAAITARVRPQRLATRIFSGRTFNVRGITTTVANYEMGLALAAPAEAIRVIVATGQTTSGDAITPKATMFAASTPSLADADVQAAARVQVLFGGSGTPSFPPAPTSARRQFYRSDWVYLPSVPRTDGFPGALYVVRGSFSLDAGSGNMVVLGNGTQLFGNWSAHPSGRHVRFLQRNGTSAGNWAGMTEANSSYASGSPIVGIEYLARGEVVSVFGFGDSITEGQGNTGSNVGSNVPGDASAGFIGSGFGFPACVAASANPAGIPFEWSNLGWSGQSMSQIKQQVADALAFGISPSMAVLPVGSPNGLGPTITKAQIDAARGQYSEMATLLETARISHIPWTLLPTNPSVKDYNATDSLRRDYNAEVLTGASRGQVICDFAGRLSGDMDADGQTQMLAGSTVDGIHPADAGNALLWPLLAEALRRHTFLPLGKIAA